MYENKNLNLGQPPSRCLLNRLQACLDQGQLVLPIDHQCVGLHKSSSELQEDATEIISKKIRKTLMVDKEMSLSLLECKR